MSLNLENNYIYTVLTYNGRKDFYDIHYNNACKIFGIKNIYTISRDFVDVCNFIHIIRNDVTDNSSINLTTDLCLSLALASVYAKSNNKEYIIYSLADYIPINNTILQVMKNLITQDKIVTSISEEDNRYRPGLHAGYFVFHNSLFTPEDPFLLTYHWEECFGMYLRNRNGIVLGDRQADIPTNYSDEDCIPTKFGVFNKLGFMHTHHIEYAKKFIL